MISKKFIQSTAKKTNFLAIINQPFGQNQGRVQNIDELLVGIQREAINLPPNRIAGIIQRFQLMNVFHIPFRTQIQQARRSSPSYNQVKDQNYNPKDQLYQLLSRFISHDSTSSLTYGAFLANLYLTKQNITKQDTTSTIMSSLLAGCMTTINATQDFLNKTKYPKDKLLDKEEIKLLLPNTAFNQVILDIMINPKQGVEKREHILKKDNKHETSNVSMGNPYNEGEDNPPPQPEKHFNFGNLYLALVTALTTWAIHEMMEAYNLLDEEEKKAFCKDNGLIYSKGKNIQEICEEIINSSIKQSVEEVVTLYAQKVTVKGEQLISFRENHNIATVSLSKEEELWLKQHLDSFKNMLKSFLKSKKKPQSPDGVYTLIIGRNYSGHNLR